MTDDATARPAGDEGRREQPLVNIVGERVALGPLRRDLLPLYARWHNDFATQSLAGFPPIPEPKTAEQATAWFEWAATGESRVWFTLYERATWEPIGYANVRDIDYRNRTAELGLTIGEPRHRGKGYGTEATRLLLDYAFTALGLHNVLLTTHARNEAALRAYHKAGFREIGRRRQSLSIGGQLWDEVYMDCHARDFASPLLSRIFVPDTPRG